MHLFAVAGDAIPGHHSGVGESLEAFGDGVLGDSGGLRQAATFISAVSSSSVESASRRQ